MTTNNQQQTSRITQNQLNDMMLDNGVSRYMSKINSAKKRGAESETKYGRRLIGGAIPLVSAAISELANSAPLERLSPVAVYLRMFDPDVAAAIVCRGVLDSVSIQKPLAGTAEMVGRMLEDERRGTVFAKSQKKYWRQFLATKGKRASYGIKRRIIMATGKRMGVAFDELDRRVVVEIGLKCVVMFMETTRLVEIKELYEGRNKTRNYVVPTKDTEAWIADYNNWASDLNPTYLPMVVRPKAWIPGQPFSGGYDFSNKRRKQICLIKNNDRRYLELLTSGDASVRMEGVIASVNHMQNTAWMVNKRVLEVVMELWQSGTSVGSLERFTDAPLPSKPIDIDTNAIARRDYRKRAALVHAQNIAGRSRRLLSAKTIHVANMFKDEPRIYFPHQLDFRGRAYPIPFFLQPQGTDMAKSLLMFAQGKAMDAEALDHMRVAGANLYGFDKQSIQARIDWTLKNQDLIMAVADDPFGNRMWHNADEPWQFLAFCFEYTAAVRHGPGYVSNLVIGLDATNNGLQILSLLMRDRVGATATNCVATASPNDIYMDVANVTNKELARMAAVGDIMAKRWLDFGINRKACKRPVMVLPYGGTLYSSRAYIEEWVQDTLKSKCYNTSPGSEWDLSRLMKPTQYLAEVVWKGINATVGSAKTAMKFLQDCAKVMHDNGLGIEWRTPCGFIVSQAYRNTESANVQCRLGGKFKKHVAVAICWDGKELSRRHQVNGISPNFVHSVDASCLHDSVVYSSKYGVSSFAMVHDSYGVLAADVDIMAESLRRMYHKTFSNNLLAEFRETCQARLPKGVELPNVPQMGDLDPAELLQSRYFFS